MSPPMPVTTLGQLLHAVGSSNEGIRLRNAVNACPLGDSLKITDMLNPEKRAWIYRMLETTPGDQQYF